METHGGGKWRILLHLLLLSLISTVRSSSAVRFRSACGAAERQVPMAEGAGFKIGLFADLHFGEDAWTEWGPRQDVNSINVMNSVLHHENPDLVIYLGDVITANNIMIANASLYWDQAISPARNRGIPWASVFGNHDDAAFQWPLEWFSAPGIPPIHCPQSTTSYSVKGILDKFQEKKNVASKEQDDWS